jgi:hypothetical protein
MEPLALMETIAHHPMPAMEVFACLELKLIAVLLISATKMVSAIHSQEIAPILFPTTPNPVMISMPAPS